jgi:hypothetical protein
MIKKNVRGRTKELTTSFNVYLTEYRYHVWSLLIPQNVILLLNCESVPSNATVLQDTSYGHSESLCPSFGIPNTRKHNVSETGTVSVFRLTNLNHWMDYVHRPEI